MIRLVSSLTLLVYFLALTPFSLAQDNVFKANLSHPEIATTIEAFENICLPFIIHTSDLTQAQDSQHHRILLKKEGFTLKDTKRDRYRIFDGTEGQFKPKVYDVRGVGQLGSRINKNTLGQFTVFKGVSDEVIKSTQTIVAQTGEMFLPGGADIPRYKTGLTELYISGSEGRLLGTLSWNPYESQKQPAKSCNIQFIKPSFSTSDVKDTLIEKDKEWFKKGLTSTWTQCVSQEEGRFLFTIDHRPEMFTINVERVDTYVEQGKKSLCDFKWLPSSVQ